MLLELRLSERLREDVRSIVRRSDGDSLDLTHPLVIGEEVDTAVDVLGSLARLEVFGQVNTRRVGVYYHLSVTSAGANVVLPDRFVTLQVAAQLLLLHEHSQVMEYRALVSNLGLFSTGATGAFEVHGDQFIASFDADDTFGIPMLLCTPLDNAIVSKFMPRSRSH